MSGECLNCSGAAAHRYTIILGPEKILAEKLLCDACAVAFRQESWLEVLDAPLLMRGDDPDDDSAD